MIRYLMVLFFLNYGIANGQTYNVTEIENSGSVLIDKNRKLTITKTKKTNQADYVIVNKESSVVPAIRNYDPSKETLTLDLSKLFTEGVAKDAFRLKLSNDVIKNLILEEDTQVITANPNVGAGAPVSDLGFTGIAVWDAQAIKKLWSSKPGSGSKELIRQWINKYVANDKEKQWDEILKNPFFKKSPLLVSAGEKVFGQGEAGLPGVKDIIGNLAGLDVTKFVQAFADFLRDRIKEELTVAYLLKLKAAIGNSEELQYMLPHTRNVFLNNDVFLIPNLGATYKAAFAQDLEDLLPNFEKLVYSSKKDLFKMLRKSEGFTGFVVAYHFADMSAKSYHPAEILQNLDGRYGFEITPTSNIAYGLSITNKFSQHLLDTSGTKWIAGSELRNFSKDEVFIFLGLLYEKYPLLFDNKKGDASLKDILLKISSSGLVDEIQQLLTIINVVDERIKAFKLSPDKERTVFGFFSNNADAITELFDYVTTLTKVQDVFSPEYNKLKTILESSLEAAKGIRENNLGKVGTNVLFVINELVPGDENWKKDLAEFIVFLTDVSNAKTSEDIKAILEHSAAPVHSYRVARTYHTSTAITSYPGLYLGLERNGTAGSTEGTFGITAPIGISFTMRARNESSNALFISLVDIGAALSYRFNNDTADLPQKVLLGQIFSPGIFGIHGLKKSPLAFKYGIQYAPLLRSIKDGNNVYKNAGVWRFGLGLSVDIPVFILSRKKEKD